MSVFPVERPFMSVKWMNGLLRGRQREIARHGSSMGAAGVGVCPRQLGAGYCHSPCCIAVFSGLITGEQHTE